jgi:protein-disulfide isomerase
MGIDLTPQSGAVSGAVSAPGGGRGALVVRIAAILLAAAGWWLSFDLLRISADMRATNPWLDAQCGGPADVRASDCLSVLRSRITGAFGLPWVALGLAYFGFIAVWNLFVGPAARGRRLWHVLPTVLTIGGAIVSALLMLVMAFTLRRWCAGCVAVHAINAVLLLVTLLAFFVAAPSGSGHPRSALALATAFGGTCAALMQITFVQLAMVNAGLGATTKAYQRIVDDPAYIRWRYESAPVQEIDLRADDAILGDREAPNTVVAFIDFQCEHCRTAHRILQQVADERAGRVRVVFRHYPEDGACNSRWKSRGGHPFACRAARAVEAARIVGGPAAFMQMKDLCYARQHEVERDRFVDWARELGLDAQQFALVIESPAVAERISADIALGDQLNITGVPAIYLNGRRLEGWSKPDVWKSLLE